MDEQENSGTVADIVEQWANELYSAECAYIDAHMYSGFATTADACAAIITHENERKEEQKREQ